MSIRPKAKLRRFVHATAYAALLLTGIGLSVQEGISASLQQTAAPSSSRAVGTIKTVSGKNITLTTDDGTEISLVVQDTARLLRVEPGEKDLKNAVPLTLDELKAGDRILVRGAAGEDGKTLLVISVIAMKKADIAQKQTHEREEWQRHGTGGLVSAVDTNAHSVTISTNSAGAGKTVTIHITSATVLRRYAPNSIKFDDAKPAPLDQIKPGDQLRARGSRSADGSELTADEIVSGSFQNVAGTVISVDSSVGIIVVTDLAKKAPLTVSITADSQLKKLSPEMAQRMAVRLKGGSPANGASSGTPTASQTSTPAAANGQRPEGARPGAGDFQQAISRLPQITLADLKKGDALMIVATSGTPGSAATVITLLAGVEPLLQAAPSSNGSSILSPWNLGSGAPGDSSP